MPDFDYCLLVDDDDAMTFIVNKVLRRMGLKVETESALDGIEAIEKIERLGPPRLILLDLRMPRMDGFAFLHHCDRVGWDMLKVVVVTSSVLPEDHQEALGHALVVEVLEKPPTREDIERLLAQAPELRELFSDATACSAK